MNLINLLLALNRRSEQRELLVMRGVTWRLAQAGPTAVMVLRLLVLDQVV